MSEGVYRRRWDYRGPDKLNAALLPVGGGTVLPDMGGPLGIQPAAYRREQVRYAPIVNGLALFSVAASFVFPTQITRATPQLYDDGAAQLSIVPKLSAIIDGSYDTIVGPDAKSPLLYRRDAATQQFQVKLNPALHVSAYVPSSKALTVPRGTADITPYRVRDTSWLFAPPDPVYNYAGTSLLGYQPREDRVPALPIVNTAALLYVPPIAAFVFAVSSPAWSRSAIPAQQPNPINGWQFATVSMPYSQIPIWIRIETRMMQSVPRVLPPEPSQGLGDWITKLIIPVAAYFRPEIITTLPFINGLGPVLYVPPTTGRYVSVNYGSRGQALSGNRGVIVDYWK